MFYMSVCVCVDINTEQKTRKIIIKKKKVNKNMRKVVNLVLDIDTCSSVI